ncbi:hypothetical protein ACVWZV_009450 [Bradyrhizobium sp. GM5.1]
MESLDHQRKLLDRRSGPNDVQYSTAFRPPAPIAKFYPWRPRRLLRTCFCRVFQA